MAIDGTFSDDQLAQTAARLGLPDTILTDLHAHLRDPCAVERANLPPTLRKAVQSLHLDTHWHLGDDPSDVCRTTVGTRPGDAFADVIFGYLWSRVLQAFQDSLSTVSTFDSFPCDVDLRLPGAGDSRTTPPASEAPFVGTCWMDDLCLAFSAPTCDDLQRIASYATSSLLDQCISHGMSPIIYRLGRLNFYLPCVVLVPEPRSFPYMARAPPNTFSSLENTMAMMFDWSLRILT